MSEQAHILLVDDDTTMTEIERFQLGDEVYRFSTAGDGLEALERIAADAPDVVLLDVEMPNLDGLETCRRIRANEDFEGITVIFVTGKNDADTRKAAYEAGGDDVLAKPLDPDEIQRKVGGAVRSRRMVADLQKEMAETSTVLMSTIVTSGEYGVVMNFFRNSYACKSMAELAEVVLQALDDFALSGSVQLRAGEEILTLNTERRASPLEQEMLYNLSLENRHIYDYGTRTAFCYPNVAVLVKTMPVEEPDAYGRVKDNIALLAEGAEFRLKALREETRVRQQREALIRSVSVASGLLKKVDADYKRGQSAMGDIFDRLERGLEWSFSGLGLSEDQEQAMWGIVRPLAFEATSLYDEGVRLDESLSAALGALRASLGETEQLQDPVGKR